MIGTAQERQRLDRPLQEKLRSEKMREGRSTLYAPKTGPELKEHRRSGWKPGRRDLCPNRSVVCCGVVLRAHYSLGGTKLSEHNSKSRIKNSGDTPKFVFGPLPAAPRQCRGPLWHLNEELHVGGLLVPDHHRVLQVEVHQADRLRKQGRKVFRVIEK